MKKNLFIIIILLNVISNVFPQTTFYKSIGGALNESGNALTLTTSGDIVVTGFSESFGAGDTSLYVTRIDSAGQVEWAYVYEINGATSRGTDIRETSDHGFVLSGNIWDGVSHSAFIAKIDSSGNFLWGVNTFSSEDCDGNAVEVMADGGFVLAGWTAESAGGYADAFLVKVDDQGNYLWSRTYHASGNDNVKSILSTADGGLLLGISDNGTQRIAKVDSGGNFLWGKVYPGQFLSSVSGTGDEGFIITGTMDTIGFDMHLVRADSSGNMLWQKHFAHETYNDFGTSAVQTADGGFILVGSTDGFSGSSPGIGSCAIRTDSLGNLIWSMIYDPAGNPDQLYGVRESTDGGFVMTGYFYGISGQLGDISLLKTNGQGSTGCHDSPMPVTVYAHPVQQTSFSLTDTVGPGSVQLILTPAPGLLSVDKCIPTSVQTLPEYNLVCWPNPVMNELKFKDNLNLSNSRLTVEIRNTLGQKLKTVYISNPGSEFSISTVDVPAGEIHVLVYSEGEIIMAGRLIKQ